MLLRQCLSFKTYKTYITAIFTHLVSKLCKKKNLRCSFRAMANAAARISYICSTPELLERNLCDSFEAYIIIRWDTASWCARNSCEKRYSLFLCAVSDYKRFDWSSYFIIINFHTELKPQLKDSHQWRTQKISEVRAKWAMLPLKSVENIVILCFERRFSKQNSVIRLKLSIFAYTAEYWQYTLPKTVYTFLFLGSEGRAMAQWPPHSVC